MFNNKQCMNVTEFNKKLEWTLCHSLPDWPDLTLIKCSTGKIKKTIVDNKNKLGPPT